MDNVVRTRKAPCRFAVALCSGHLESTANNYQFGDYNFFTTLENNVQGLINFLNTYLVFHLSICRADMSSC